MGRAVDVGGDGPKDDAEVVCRSGVKGRVESRSGVKGRVVVSLWDIPQRPGGTAGTRRERHLVPAQDRSRGTGGERVPRASGRPGVDHKKWTLGVDETTPRTRRVPDPAKGRRGKDGDGPFLRLVSVETGPTPWSPTES